MLNLIAEPIIKNRKIENRRSDYFPAKLVRERLMDIRKQMAIADEIRNKSYREFNNRSLIKYQDDCQKTFNNYIPPVSDNADERWRANTIRPITRNKVISIVAHVTSAIMEPVVEAQNEKAISDKEAAMIMKDLMDFVLDQCKYSRKFVFGMIAAAVNPAVIFNLEYLEVIRKFKEILSDGTWKEKEKLDEVFSGFLLNIVPVEELFIGDFYEGDLQKQPFLIRRRLIDFNHAKIKYESFKDFKYVQPGVRVFFDGGSNTFYEADEEQLGNRKVEEVIFFDRFADLELPIVNGVLMTKDPDRPMQRFDKLYPFAKTGYELIDEGRCFYYKSLVDKMAPDQSVVDAIYNMIIDGTFISLFPPMANYGGEEVRSSVLIPGVTTNFSDPNSKLSPLLPPINIGTGMATLQKIESSVSESSQDPAQSGNAQSLAKTAQQQQMLEENAKKVLGLFGKMISFVVEDLGDLIIGSILQFMTLAEIEEVIGDVAKLNYKSILVPDRTINGKKMPRRIDFEMPEENQIIEEQFQVPGLAPEQQTILQQSSKLRKEGEELGMSIAKVNPELFRNRKYKIKTKADFMKPSSEAITKAFNLEAYDRAIGNPLANQENIFRDFLLSNYKPGEEEKYINKQPQMSPQMEGENMEALLGAKQPALA